MLYRYINTTTLSRVTDLYLSSVVMIRVPNIIDCYVSWSRVKTCDHTPTRHTHSFHSITTPLVIPTTTKSLKITNSNNSHHWTSSRKYRKKVFIYNTEAISYRFILGFWSLYYRHEIIPSVCVDNDVHY